MEIKTFSINHRHSYIHIIMVVVTEFIQYLLRNAAKTAVCTYALITPRLYVQVHGRVIKVNRG